MNRSQARIRAAILAIALATLGLLVAGHTGNPIAAALGIAAMAISTRTLATEAKRR